MIKTNKVILRDKEIINKTILKVTIIILKNRIIIIKLIINIKVNNKLNRKLKIKIKKRSIIKKFSIKLNK